MSNKREKLKSIKIKFYDITIVIYYRYFYPSFKELICISLDVTISLLESLIYSSLFFLFSLLESSLSEYRENR